MPCCDLPLCRGRCDLRQWQDHSLKKISGDPLHVWIVVNGRTGQCGCGNGLGD
jgi:hypothetical protein